MKKRVLTFWISGALAAAAMAAAVTAPAEVIDNLDFFSDFELLANLEILENETEEDGAVEISTSAAAAAVPSVSTAAFAALRSTGTVKIPVPAGRSYEKR
jgi:hypothetical protein